jgi:hypothetical protein
MAAAVHPDRRAHARIDSHSSPSRTRHAMSVIFESPVRNVLATFSTTNIKEILSRSG